MLNTNKAALDEIMAQHRLTVADVADLLDCKSATIHCWRTRDRKYGIPDNQLDRLRLKLEIRELRKRLAYLEAKINNVA